MLLHLPGLAGIPKEKLGHLFTKYQQSLDSLGQGTGIGLYLCKSLIDLFGGEIVLDANFCSGVEGCVGSRFVINLKTPPISVDAVEPSDEDPTDVHSPSSSVSKGVGSNGEKSGTKATTPETTLPRKLSVLLVDDDAIVRKLFIRSVGRIVPDWELQEAANGETAILLAESNKYDLIFVDQYMASVDKQLLGTETVRALRANGVESIICGLSANDLEQQFKDAGADAFIMKPFPCQKAALERELERVLSSAEEVAEKDEPFVRVGLQSWSAQAEPHV